MKKMTDYFQSLKLVAAGVPAESADNFFYDERREPKALEITSVPCWSIGALWEFIFENCGDRVFEFSSEMSTSELMDALVETACSLMKSQINNYNSSIKPSINL